MVAGYFCSLIHIRLHEREWRFECPLSHTVGYRGRTTSHGFCHTASTVLNEHGFNHDHIERQLAHVEPNKVRGTYNRAENLPERGKMMQW